MKRHLPFYLLLLLGTFFLSACNVTQSDLSNFPIDDPGILYSNSFESSEDIANWDGNGGGIQLREEAPEGGGKMSAYVAGACVHPHSALEFRAPENAVLSLNAWAKNLAIGGGIMLHNKTSDKSIFIHVEDKDWARLTSENKLVVNKEDKIELSMSAGGFVASSMLVTSVEIKVSD